MVCFCIDSTALSIFLFVYTSASLDWNSDFCCDLMLVFCFWCLPISFQLFHHLWRQIMPHSFSLSFVSQFFFQTVWMTILMGMFFSVFFIKDDKEEIIFRLSDMRQSISATVIEINYCFCGNSQHNLITLNIKNKVGFIVNKLFGLIVPHLINW